MRKELKEIQQLVDKVHGWLSPHEGITLYNLAKNCTGKGVVVEIGSWQGKSTIWLAKGSKKGNNVKIYAIDPHTGSSEHKEAYGKVWTFNNFKKNINKANVEDIVVPILKYSDKAAKTFNKPVELIFIDGSHEYDLVKLDFELWFPKVIDGGIIAFHDTVGWEGPKRLVKEIILKSRNFKSVKFADYSITYGRKVKKNSVFDRIRGRYVLILKNLYEIPYNLNLPKPFIYFMKVVVRSLQ
ncbi:class I SAM-dependent methyltransferase [Candidatus Woesearchaeota archaeon]|nr:class I SAM-dependent methyltransferase [Candidatus Woesearchaeota archaeon]